MTSQPQVERVREALRALVDLSGLSRREIERRLAKQGCGLDLNRMLNGKFEIRIHQILDLIRVLDIQPMQFFRLVFKETERSSPLLEKIQDLFAPAAALPQARTPGNRLTQPDLDEIRRKVHELARLVDQAGVRSR
jgi:hypothetical protein